MAVELVLSAETEEDLTEGYAWYENRRLGLGEEFLSSVEACLVALCRTPEGHPVVHETYRRALVRRFPYAVFYEYLADTATATVYCVFHTSREPRKWRQRLP